MAEEPKPWTMGDLRRWVAERPNVPDDRELDAALPPVPHTWARAGVYMNTLLGLDAKEWFD
jgi:hypothetical protein